MSIQISIDAVNAAVEANDLQKAIPLAFEAIRIGARHPLVYKVAAHGLQLERRYSEAMDNLARAAKLAPDDPYVIIGIGQICSQQGRLQEAGAAFRRALSMDSTLPAAHHGLGLVLELQDELGRAREHFEEAARLAPDFADPLGSLALQALQRRDYEQARRFAEEALALDAFQAPAAITLMTLLFEAGDLAGAEGIATALLQQGQLPPLHESSVYRLLGDILDAAGRHLEAFEAYQRGNRLFRQVYQPLIEATGGEAGVEFVKRLEENFAARADLDWSPPLATRTADEPLYHVVMTGFFRSGTTLLEQILAAHPDVETMEEITILDDLAWRFFKTAEGLNELAAISAQSAAELRVEYWRRVRAVGRNANRRVFVDKLPMASLWTPFIAKVFPQAKILWVRRDPRDVVLSCFRHRFQPGTLRNDLADIERGALLYAGMMQLFEDYRRKLPLSLHITRHEDLVRDFDAQVKGICDFIGVDWDPDMRNFAETALRRTIRTPSARQVTRGLNGEGIGRWRPYTSAMVDALAILEPWVVRFNYPRD